MLQNLKSFEIFTILSFFIVSELIYIYPSIFIYYLVTLSFVLYMIYSLSYHKYSIITSQKIIKICDVRLKLYEKILKGEDNIISVCEKSAKDLENFPTNIMLFSEKKINITALTIEVLYLNLADSFAGFLEKQEVAEDTLYKGYVCA